MVVKAPLLLLVLLAVPAACSGHGNGGGGRALRVSGSTTINPVAADAAEALRKDGLEVTVDTQGGSAGGIAQLAAGQVDVAMSSKPVGDDDRRRHARLDFVSTPIGEDAVGVVVRREAWGGGVKSLSRDQLKELFEGRVSNWEQLGGPDLGVFVYDKEPGRGTREVLDEYLYEDAKPPPPPTSNRYAVVGGNEETRAKLLSTEGSVGPLSVAFIQAQPKLAAVAVDGVQPTPGHVQDRSYPLSRPLFLITNGAPKGDAKRFVDYVRSEAGQALVRTHGFLTLADLGRP